MTAWQQARQAIIGHRRARLILLIKAMSPQERRAVADELPALLRAERERVGWISEELAHALLVAGAGTIGGPAAAAAWVCRADLRTWWVADGLARRLARQVASVTEHRTPQWREEFARRIVGRLRVDSSGDRNTVQWHIVAKLTRDAGAEPPTVDAFVHGWVRWGTEPRRLATDPFLDALVPRLFEADGIGALLRWEVSPSHPVPTWARVLADLARDGRLKREMLLDGCLRRFLRGGQADDLRWFVTLHGLLEPTVEEVTGRLRDYVRLLPAAPALVAEAALREVRRADEARALEEPLFLEAAEALLFRPEKKLVRTTLGWLDRTARKHGRVDATVRAVTALFAGEDLDLRERAVKIAAKHAAKAGEDVRQAVRDAAADLPADLRALIAESCGPIEDVPAAPLPVPEPPPFAPRRPPAPIASPEELVEEIVAQYHRTSWSPLDRLLAATVEFTHRDPEGVRKAMRQMLPGVVPWAFHGNPSLDADYPAVHLAAAVHTVIKPKYRHPVTQAMSAFLHGARQPHRSEDFPVPHLFLLWRMRAAVQAVGRQPTLLATPTEATGHVDPDTLVSRMALLEEAGVAPNPADLHQALLRVPRQIDPAAVTGARRLSSPAGRTVADWLASGGLSDPVITCASSTVPRMAYQGYPSFEYREVPITRILPSVTLPEGTPHIIAALCGLPDPNDGLVLRPHYAFFGGIAAWPSMFPSHREMAAAHLLHHLPEWIDDRRSQGAALLALAEADGPVGAATATALVYGLAARYREERAGAVDAVLALCGRGQLPAADLGTAVATLVKAEGLKLNRIVGCLADVARAGAYADVWTVVSTALPGLLPTPGERPRAGLADLIALGTQSAEVTGARGHLPGLADVTARGGSSRLVREATRLHRLLSP